LAIELPLVGLGYSEKT